MSETALLEARDLHRRYPGQQAVAGVSLSLQRGDILGLLGRNGAGKSTTLRMLAGALHPDRGEVCLQGRPLRDSAAARASIGYLPEQAPLYADLRVEEYLRFAARLRGVTRARLHHAVEQVLESCALGARRKRLCGQLSKGYRQRLGIAQAIVHQPQVVILDEPANGLDPVQNRDIRALLTRLAESAAILLSSHVLPEIETLCNRVLVLHEGRVVFESPLPLPADARRLRLHAPEARSEALAGLSGVARAESLDEGWFLLHLEESGDPPALCRALCAAGIPVHALCPCPNDLERLFSELAGQR